MSTDEKLLYGDADSNRSGGDQDTAQSSGGACCCPPGYTPRVLLWMLTTMNFLTYFDRGAISGALERVRTDPLIRGEGNAVLSDTLSGALVSAFMVGFMLTAPIFANVGIYVKTKSLIVVGVLIWCFACVSTSFSVNYGMLITSRCVVGVGEAAYMGYGFTMLDNVAPKGSRTLWIAIFYSTIPFGNAVGMAIGAIVASSSRAAIIDHSAWRVVFLAEAIVMIPLLVMFFFLPDRYNVVSAMSTEPAHSGDTTSVSKTRKGVSLPQAALRLLKNPIFLLLSLGNAVYTFVLGAVAAFAIPALVEGPMAFSDDAASALVGGCVAIVGMLASVVGGHVADKLVAGKETRQQTRYQLAACAIVLLVTTPIGIAAFMITNIGLFIVFVILLIFGVFSVTGPTNALTLSVVDWDIRTYSVTFAYLILHCLGDFPSPLIAGRLADEFSGWCRQFNTPLQCQPEVFGAGNATMTTTIATFLSAGATLAATATTGRSTSSASASTTVNPSTSFNATAMGASCRWIDQKNGNGFCVQPEQTMKALSVVMCVMVFGSVVWGFGAWLAPRRPAPVARPTADESDGAGDLCVVATGSSRGGVGNESFGADESADSGSEMRTISN